MEENYIVGTCQTMCPVREAKLRQKENLIHKFEMKKGTECRRRPDYDPDRIVKSFSRSAAGMETTSPSNLRPFPVLMKTIEYLYLEIFPQHKDKPLLVYNFMFDRFRAVRQDAVIQNLPPGETVQVLEPIVKFLIYFGYILAEENSSNFDLHINNTHLQECLKRLLVCYSEPGSEISPNRWDIEAAYLLFNLGNIKPLTRGVCLPQVDETYLYCLQLSVQWHLRNFLKVFKMIVKLPLLLLCTVSSSVPDIRKHTLQALCYAYSSANSSYPISRLKSLMLYNNYGEVVDDCKYFNVRVSDGNANFSKKDFNSTASCTRRVRLKWVDEKLTECDLVRLLHLGKR